MARRKAASKAVASETRLDWIPGETPLSNLGPEEIKKRLGLQVNEAELQATAKAIVAVEAMSALRAIAVPTSVDWRNGNWITPIKDQASCGSCVSFGTLATLEARLRIACKNASMNIDLSEAHLFYCGCGNCCDPGWTFAPALDFCKNNGVGVETAFPYTPSDQPCRSTPPPYVKISAWTSVLSVQERKSVLSSKGPMVAGMAVFSDFRSYTGGVYRKTPNSVLRGYHCISVIGYDDTQSCWICKNSWGDAWGEQGFFRIGYGECDIDTRFAFFDMDVLCPPPLPVDDCSRFVPYLRAVLAAARTNATLRAYLRYYVCGRGAPPIIYNPAAARVVKSVRLVLARCPQYRVPFCQILG